MDTFETSRLISDKSNRVLDSLAQVLANYGWRNITVHQESRSLSAELLDTEQVSAKDFFVIVVTCIPLSDTTELLLSIATNNLDSAAFHGTAIIDRALQQLEQIPGTVIEHNASRANEIVSQVELNELVELDGRIYGNRAC